MASTICRLTYLVVIFAIVLTGFGWGLRVIIQPEYYNVTTHNQVNVTCIADERQGWNESVQNIRITSQCQDEPIATITTTQPSMEQNIRDNMKAVGQIDNNSGQSFLTLTINKPCLQDAGSYRCQMVVTDENNQTLEESVTAFVKFENQYTKDMRDLGVTISNLVTTAGDFGATHDENTRVLDQHQREIDIMMYRMEQMKKTNMITQRLNLVTEQVCPDGWTFYIHDRTCLKAFAKYNRSRRLSWPKAREACQDHGGDLVTILDGVKNNVVYNLFNRSSYWPWIGIKNHNSSGFDFRYVNGSKIGSYSNWREDQPNGFHSGEYCVAMFTEAYGPGWWFDTDCLDKSRYVCSIPARRHDTV